MIGVVPIDTPFSATLAPIGKDKTVRVPGAGGGTVVGTVVVGLVVGMVVVGLVVGLVVGTVVVGLVVGIVVVGLVVGIVVVGLVVGIVVVGLVVGLVVGTVVVGLVVGMVVVGGAVPIMMTPCCMAGTIGAPLPSGSIMVTETVRFVVPVASPRTRTVARRTFVAPGLTASPKSTALIQSESVGTVEFILRPAMAGDHTGRVNPVISALPGSVRLIVMLYPDNPSGRLSAVMVKSRDSPAAAIVPLSTIIVVAATPAARLQSRIRIVIIVCGWNNFIWVSSLNTLNNFYFFSRFLLISELFVFLFILI